MTLRQGVSFHDGSTFDAGDVVATCRALPNPVYAATVRSDFPMLTGVEKIDATAHYATRTCPTTAPRAGRRLPRAPPAREAALLGVLLTHAGQVLYRPTLADAAGDID